MKSIFKQLTKEFLLIFLLCVGCLELKANQLLLDTYASYRPYNEVCWLTTHNAFANSADAWKYSQQNLSFQEQYNFGVRSFMLDLAWYKTDSGNTYIALCHEGTLRSKPWCPSTRFFRGGKTNPISLKNYFLQIKQWLDGNPEDIITLHFESYLGPTGGSELRNLLQETGLEDYLYMDKFPKNFTTTTHLKWPGNHKVPLQWPTLGQIRKTNGRLVIFSNNLDDEMLSVTSYSETAYDLTASPN
jgi:hypothetical protein